MFSQQGSHYGEVKHHFDNADDSQQRGHTSESWLLAYAAHLLERVRPKQGARLLDVGCGDGLPMAMIYRMRPDLTIDGLELSENLACQAMKNNKNSTIFIGNALDNVLPEGNYDGVFSFSVIQYIQPVDLLKFQTALAYTMRGGDYSLLYTGY
jgi:trans-aconitate methyltransferase